MTKGQNIQSLVPNSRHCKCKKHKCIENIARTANIMNVLPDSLPDTFLSQNSIVFSCFKHLKNFQEHISSISSIWQKYILYWFAPLLCQSWLHLFLPRSVTHSHSPFLTLNCGFVYHNAILAVRNRGWMFVTSYFSGTEHIIFRGSSKHLFIWSVLLTT